MKIQENVKKILNSIPAHVRLCAVTKTRGLAEINQAIAAGVTIIGGNYLQECRDLYQHIPGPVQKHFIGHLQSNKVKAVVSLFDMIETVDSVKLAAKINSECEKIDKVMPVLIEVNSGKELSKHGVFPEDVPGLIAEIHCLEHIRLCGLMTMGPFSSDPEDCRPYYRTTKRVFDQLAAEGLAGEEFKTLSMGMSDSYLVAIEEGANLIRLGTALFGVRG